MSRARVLAVAAVCLAASALAQAASSERWQIQSARGRLNFYAEVLKDLGAVATPAAARDVDDRVAVAFTANGDLALDAPGSAFKDVLNGQLRLASKGVLSGPAGQIELDGLVVRRGVDSQTLELLGAGGRKWFDADHMHFAVDRKAGAFRMYNLDVRLTEESAQRLMGDPRYAGQPVAVLELEAAVPALVGSVEQPLGGCTTPNWGAPVHGDVALINISSVSQQARDTTPPARVAISPSSVLKNAGDTDVPWYSKFSGSFPPYDNDQHPLLVWDMFRMVNGTLEQIGVSPLKHAFTTTNNNCACAGGSILWVGCEDTYGTSTNDSISSLGPRSELLASVGYWQKCQSIFDTNCDGTANATPPRANPMDRRMAVLESDLQTPGATYYFDSWYVVRDDVNIFNTMGWRTVTPTAPVPPATMWTFALGAPLTQGPVIDQWVNPAAPGPNADSVTINTPHGKLRLAVKATNVGGGLWSYDYALMNFDFDSAIKSFSIALPTGVSPTASGFRDVDQSASTDWPATVASNAISWTAPNAASVQNWSTLYNFRFTIAAAPTSAGGSQATLGIQTARGATLQPSVLGPSTSLTVAEK